MSKVVMSLPKGMVKDSVTGGLLALVVTFGPAVAARWPEASLVMAATDKAARRLRR